MPDIVLLPADYAAWLAELKTRNHFMQAVLAQLSNSLLDNCRRTSQRVQGRIFTTTNISELRRSGRECRNLAAMDGESFSHPCELDAGNPYRHDGLSLMVVKLNLPMSLQRFRMLDLITTNISKSRRSGRECRNLVVRFINKFTN